jgi:hypothetical protein
MVTTLSWLWRPWDAEAPGTRPPAWRLAAALGLFGALVAGWLAYAEQAHRVHQLDIDGWGVLATRMQAPGARFTDLFHEPSFWRGPIVPFVFGVVMAIFQADASILVFNALVTGLAAAVFVATLTWLGVTPLLAGAAVACWLLYLPHHFLYGYWLAEPTVALFVALMLAAASLALVKRHAGWAVAAGAVAGLLILSRPPMLLALGTMTLFLAFSKRGSIKLGTVFAVALALVYLPWPIRNLAVHGTLIPFTGDGGQALFEGTWIPGDARTMGELRKMPEFRAIEERMQVLPPVARYKEWQRMASTQIAADPAGQARLVVRKALRFWVFLDPYGWRPSMKTAAAAIVLLPLALVGAWQARRTLVGQLAAMMIVAVWTFHALVYSELRYNYSVLTLTIVLAGIGAASLAEVVVSRAQRRASPEDAASLV